MSRGCKRDNAKAQALATVIVCLPLINSIMAGVATLAVSGRKHLDAPPYWLALIVLFEAKPFL